MHHPASSGASWTLAFLIATGCGSSTSTQTVSVQPTIEVSPVQSAASAEPSPTPALTVASGRSAPGDSIVAVSAATGEINAVVSVGPDPKLLETAASQVWSLNLGDGGLSRIDPTTGEATPVRVAGDAVGLAADGDDVWVAHAGRFVSRLDGTTGRVTSTVAVADAPIFALRNAGFIAVAGGRAWLTVPMAGQSLEAHEVWEVDLATGDVLEGRQVGRDPLWPILHDGALWVPVPRSEQIVRLDLRSRQLAEFSVSGSPAGFAFGSGSAWVAVEGGRRVFRLSPTDGAILAEIALDARGRGITTGGGSIWATTEAGLVHIDPATNAVRRTIGLVDPARRGSGPADVAYLDGTVWVAIE